MKELQKRKDESKAIKHSENEQFKLSIIRTEQEENQRLITRRAQKLQTQVEMRTTLDQQLESKRIARKKEKEMDKKILGVGLKKEESQDLQREQFFSKLKKIQDDNIK